MLDSTNVNITAPSDNSPLAGFLLGQSTLPYGGGGGVSQSTPPPGGRILPEVHAEPAAAGRLPGRLLPEAVAPEALAADVHKHRGEQGGGDLG